MFEETKIKDYIAKAVVLKDKMDEVKDLKQIFGTFLMLFPTGRDQMICRAVFDVMFSSEISARKLVDKMINSMNTLAPQKMTDMSDVYSEALALVTIEKQKQEKMANSVATGSGGQRLTEEEKQGSSKNDDKHGRASDPFIVINSQDPNSDLRNDEVLLKEDEKTISTVSKEELALAEIANDNVERAKKAKEQKNAEEEELKRRAYEENLKRRNKAKTGTIIGIARARD